MKLLVVGSLHLDVVLQTPHLPVLDETVMGSGVSYVFGGKGGNQALAAARMGADVSFSGRVGTDGFGEMLHQTLTESGLELSQLQVDPGPSGMSAAIVDANGDYGAVVVSAANLNIATEEIEILRETGLVMLQNEIPEAVNVLVAGKAKDARAYVWLNAAPARRLSEEMLQLADLLIVNRVENAFYEDISGSKVLETRGADGVVCEGASVPGFKVDVTSTHGAGDMFVGALAARVLSGATITDALTFAQAAAALYVSRDIRQRSEIDHADVETFVADQLRR